MKPHIKLKSAQGGAVGMAAPGSLSPVASSSFWGYLREPFAGAWQKNIQPEQPQNILAFSAVYACTSFICSDVAKLRIKLVEQPLSNSDIWTEVRRNSPFLPVLRKPNRYQTRMQFIQQWLASKYLHGNAYILKDRDARGVVTALYVLNPFYVQPLVATDGGIYYMINKEWLAGVQSHLTVPASEVIHDRCETLWHPLVGVSPIYACGASATQGVRIQANSENFFRNLSRPSGHLTAPAEISDETALRLKREFEMNFSQGNMGRLLVTGSALKYEPITMTATDAQLIDQLRWTVEDVARAYKVPMYKLSGSLPPGASIAQLNQEYYSQTLQSPIEAIELLLDEGLELPDNYGVSLDLDGLLRMDPLTRSETARNFVTSGVWSPNEGRAKENLPPVPGGAQPYLQQQMYSLEALAKRDSLAPAPPSPPIVDPPAMPNTEELVNVAERFDRLETSVAQLAEGLKAMVMALAKTPPPPDSPDDSIIDVDEFHRELETCLLGAP